MIDVSTTSTNIAMESKMASGLFTADSSVALKRASSVNGVSHSVLKIWTLAARVTSLLWKGARKRFTRNG
jgi:hypothetical protein